MSDNTASGADGGGAILNTGTCPSAVTIINSTLFENQANALPGFEGHGDAIANYLFTPQFTLKNSIIASPTRGLNLDCYAGQGPGGAFVGTSLGHNIVSDASAKLTGTADLNSTNPLLGPLADNGGPTRTHAPLRSSPAIDAVPLADGTDANGNPLRTDQRGVARPQGTAFDIGSVELSNNLATVTQPPQSQPSGTGTRATKNKFAIEQNSNGTLTVSWPPDEDWILQEAANVLGPWSSSASQRSPVSLRPGSANRFYRLVKP